MQKNQAITALTRILRQKILLLQAGDQKMHVNINHLLVYINSKQQIMHNPSTHLFNCDNMQSIGQTGRSICNYFM